MSEMQLCEMRSLDGLESADLLPQTVDKVDAGLKFDAWRWPRRLFLSLVACGATLLITMGFGSMIEGNESAVTSLFSIRTDFGEVPYKLELSGVDCPLRVHFNGVYKYSGKTHDGRPFYQHDTEDAYMYYEQKYVEKFGAWVLAMSKPSTSKSDHLISNPGGDIIADVALPSHHSPLTCGQFECRHEKAGALPPPFAPWAVQCGHTFGWTKQAIKVSGGQITLKHLRKTGSWKYLHTIPRRSGHQESGL